MSALEASLAAERVGEPTTARYLGALSFVLADKHVLERAGLTEQDVALARDNIDTLIADLSAEDAAEATLVRTLGDILFYTGVASYANGLRRQHSRDHGGIFAYSNRPRCYEITTLQDRLRKHFVGEPTASGGPFRADGTSDVSQADADSRALTALNAQRRHRFGGSPGRASEATTNSVGSRGGAMTTDSN
jgi:hypothetical protein